MELPQYFDIHSHLNFADYDNDREGIIAKLKENNIFTTTVGTDFKTSQEAVRLAEMHENLFATIGLHPADNASELFDEKIFGDLVKHKKTVAIGECGLDYFRLKPESEKLEKEKQKKEFEKQILFAVEHNKPLMIHCRDAYDDILNMLASKKQEYGNKVRGNFHFFTSPIEIAKKCLEIGFTVSFTGPITYSNQYDDIVSYVPLEMMMTETDAPFAAPVPFRGKRNDPLYVKEIVQKIAAIKNMDLDKVKLQLVKNAFDVFLKESLPVGV